APTLVFRLESSNERTNRVPQLTVAGLMLAASFNTAMCDHFFPGGTAVEKMVAHCRVETCGEHQAGDRLGLGGVRNASELLLGPQIGRDHGSRAPRSHGTLVHHIAHARKQRLVGEERAYERRHPEMKGERALQHPREILLYRVLPDLQ